MRRLSAVQGNRGRAFLIGISCLGRGRCTLKMDKETPPLDYGRPPRVPSRFAQFLEDRFDIDVFLFVIIISGVLATAFAIYVLVVTYND